MMENKKEKEKKCKIIIKSKILTNAKFSTTTINQKQNEGSEEKNIQNRKIKWDAQDMTYNLWSETNPQLLSSTKMQFYQSNTILLQSKKQNTQN